MLISVRVDQFKVGRYQIDCDFGQNSQKNNLVPNNRKMLSLFSLTVNKKLLCDSQDDSLKMWSAVGKCESARLPKDFAPFNSFCQKLTGENRQTQEKRLAQVAFFDSQEEDSLACQREPPCPVNHSGNSLKSACIYEDSISLPIERKSIFVCVFLVHFWWMTII